MLHTQNPGVVDNNASAQDDYETVFEFRKIHKLNAAHKSKDCGINDATIEGDSRRYGKDLGEGVNGIRGSKNVAKTSSDNTDKNSFVSPSADIAATVTPQTAISETAARNDTLRSTSPNVQNDSMISDASSTTSTQVAYLISTNPINPISSTPTNTVIPFTTSDTHPQIMGVGTTTINGIAAAGSASSLPKSNCCATTASHSTRSTPQNTTPAAGTDQAEGIAPYPGPTENILPDFFKEDIVNVDLTADALAKQTFTAFSILEPWCLMKAVPDQVITSIRNNIVAQGCQYIVAIDLSVDMARKGTTFAETALNMCDELLDPNVSVAKLEEYKVIMEDLAGEAKTGAHEVKRKFKDVRGGLLQIWRNNLPQVSSGDIDPAALMVELPERRLFENSGRRTGNVIQAPLTDTEKQLNAAYSDMDALVNVVGAYANWWDRKVTQLTGLVTFAKMISLNYEVKKIIRRRWEIVRTNFQSYSQKISLVQDFYKDSKLKDATPLLPARPAITVPHPPVTLPPALAIVSHPPVIALPPPGPVAVSPSPSVIPPRPWWSRLIHWLTCGCCG